MRDSGESQEAVAIWPEDVASLEATLKEEYGVRNVLTGYVGPTLGVHTGPGVLRLFHVGIKR